MGAAAAIAYHRAMLSAEPPRVVVEHVALCAEGGSASEAFSRAIGASVGPEPGWTLRIELARDERETTAEGRLFDAHGTEVGRRTLRAPGRACAPLARAIGVWASLALDDAMARAAEARRAREKRDARSSTAEPPAATAAGEHAGAALWPEPASVEPPSPESELFLRHAPSSRTFEIGASGLITSGWGSGPLAGGAVFGILEIGGGVFLRPAISYGASNDTLTNATGLEARWWGSRLDGCGRIPGFYRERRGLQLDLCGGAEVGFVGIRPRDDVRATSAADKTLPELEVGPSFALRGELGGALSAELRGSGFVDVVREGYLSASGASVVPPLFGARAELGLSWRVE